MSTRMADAKFREGIDWRKTPCQNPPKGEACHLCGGRYICGDLTRPKKEELERRATLGVASGSQTKLQVWFGCMPESNGKANWTAILHRGELSEGHTIDRSEHHDRARYEADRVRWLIGERDTQPDILDYDADMLSPEGWQHPCGVQTLAAVPHGAPDNWSASNRGPSVGDLCPGCGEVGTMVTACPKCGGYYVLLAEADLVPAGVDETPTTKQPDGIELREHAEAQAAALGVRICPVRDAACVEVPAVQQCTDCPERRSCKPDPDAQLVPIATLRQHWLSAMECDHATSRDKPHCSCSLVDLGWHPSVGAAVEAWLAHVAGVQNTDGGQR